MAIFLIFAALSNSAIKKKHLICTQLRDENSLIYSFSFVILPEPVENGCLDKFLSYFQLPPPKHVHLFTVSLKNQARLTRKIVGSY